MNLNLNYKKLVVFVNLSASELKLLKTLHYNHQKFFSIYMNSCQLPIARILAVNLNLNYSTVGYICQPFRF